MQSKRSFFNPTLFRKNMSRFWPLWGGVTAAGCLLPLYLLLYLLSLPQIAWDPSELGGALYPVAAYFVPAASFAYAILVAMVVWSYLYNPRSMGLMHTLPIHRWTLFCTNTLSGFAMLLIPYAAVGGFVCILALCWGFMDLGAVLTTVAAVLLMTVLFFGLATLCAMVTGNVFALPAFYLVVNFVAPVLDILLSMLASGFLVGVEDEYTGAVEFLSPLVRIYRDFRYDGVHVGDGAYEHILTGFGTVALYGLAGLAFFALAWLLYRRRSSESAGSVVAFRWLRPVFRFGVALAFALTTGQALYHVIWGIFQTGLYVEGVPMAVCMALTGLVGYYAASMLLDKTLRVFSGSLPGAAAVICAAAVLALCVRLDLMGLESRVPGAEEVDSVYVYTSNMVGYTPNIRGDEAPELLEKVLAMHTAIAGDADRVREMDPLGIPYTTTEGGRGTSYQNVHLRYTLTDGTTLSRRYQLCLQREYWEAGTGIEGAFRELFAGSRIQLYQICGPAGSEVNRVDVYRYGESYREETEHELDEQALYQAITADAREGKLYSYDLFDSYENNSYPVVLELEFRFRSADGGSKGYLFDYRSVDLRPTMVHTIAFLLENGVITDEELLRWNSEREISAEVSEKYGLYAPRVGGADGPTTVYVAD